MVLQDYIKLSSPGTTRSGICAASTIQNGRDWKFIIIIDEITKDPVKRTDINSILGICQKCDNKTNFFNFHTMQLADNPASGTCSAKIKINIEILQYWDNPDNHLCYIKNYPHLKVFLRFNTCRQSSTPVEIVSFESIINSRCRMCFLKWI